MTIKTNVKAGGLNIQHNETLAVRSDVKAGGILPNHNETLTVRSDLKAGALCRYCNANHNETFRR